MDEEIERALAPWHDGLELDLYTLGARPRAAGGDAGAVRLRPRRAARGTRPAREFERALGFYGREYWLQVLRGPGTPWQAQVDARGRLDRLIYAEIAQRRRSGSRGDDVLSLLLDAPFSDRHVRDHVMTLLFAGHDTTTATIAFLFYELARHPEIAAAVSGDDALLDQALDETLRLYPPAWIGPRRADKAFEFGGAPRRRRRAGQLLLLGLAPTARRVGGAERVPPRALRARERGRASPRAPTSRSAAARGSASGCASASSRSRRSPRP